MENLHKLAVTCIQKWTTRQPCPSLTRTHTHTHTHTHTSTLTYTIHSVAHKHSHILVHTPIHNTQPAASSTHTELVISV